MNADDSRARRTRLAAALALWLWLIPGVAQAGDKALAESLFIQGRELMQAERYAEACPKLERSNEADPSAGTLLNLGICYEKLGRTASAWATYKQTVVRAKVEGRAQHADAASAAAKRLEPGLSKLTIAPTHPLPAGFTIKRGEVTLGREALGAPVAVDPGDYSIEASAPGHESFTTTVSISGGERKVIDIPQLAKSETPSPAISQSPTSSTAPAAPPTLERSSTNKTLGYVLVGAGAAVAAGGLVFGYLAQRQASDAEDDPELCPDKRCTPDGRDEIDSAETKALVSTIGVGVGLVTVGAGIYFLVSSSRREPGPHARRTRLVPIATSSGGGLSLSGSF